MLKIPKSSFFEPDRSSLQPEVNEWLEDRIAADCDWFDSHPKTLCYFRPLEAVEEAPYQNYGQGLLYLVDPDDVPVESQTWVALVDVLRLKGIYEKDSCRMKFRCPPVDLNDPEQLEFATATALGCAQWCQAQQRAGKAKTGFIQGRSSSDTAGKGFA
jgi:hypothetical protein